MCREAMEKLGWSVYVFDTRMENHVSSMRSRAKKKAKRKQEVLEIGSDTDTPDDSRRSPSGKLKGGKDKRPEPAPVAREGEAKSYSPNAKISLVRR